MSRHNGCVLVGLSTRHAIKPASRAMKTPDVTPSCAAFGLIIHPDHELEPHKPRIKVSRASLEIWLLLQHGFGQAGLVMNRHPIVLSLLLASLTFHADVMAQNRNGAGAGLPEISKSSDYRPVADKLIQAATGTDFAYKRLAELCDTFGPRFSGTTNLDAAVDW